MIARFVFLAQNESQEWSHTWKAGKNDCDARFHNARSYSASFMETYKLPRMKIPERGIFCERETFKFQINGIGKTSTAISVTTLGIAIPML